MSKHPSSILESAHKYSSNHRNEVMVSERCGCFFCQETFTPSEIEEWVDVQDGVGTTALCPRCGVDSVLGSSSGHAITPEFLRDMNAYWFF